MIDNQFSNHDFSHYAEAEKDICGIWAVFGDVNSDITQQIFACMKIAHRGPDQFKFQNLNLKKNAVVGFHRLAVMDGYHRGLWWILTTNPCSHFKHCNILTICCVIMEKYTTTSRWVGTTTVNTLLFHQKMIKTNECCLWCMSFVCISTYLNDVHVHRNLL